MVVHKQHCSKLASARKGEGGDLVGIFSHHPYSDSKLSDDPHEAQVVLVQKILLKIQSSNQPAFTRVQSQLLQLGEVIKWCLEQKKLRPGGFKNHVFGSCVVVLRNQTAFLVDKDLIRQEL